jgi:hypothetical protein
MMKVILELNTFNRINAITKEIINASKSVPDNVFYDGWRHFLFAPFEDMLLPLSFDHIKEFLTGLKEKEFWLTTIEPDPLQYIHANFGYYGTFEFSINDTTSDYLSALHDFPSSSPADAMAHNGVRLLALSCLGRWAAYFDRDNNITIFAFRDLMIMESFKQVYGPDLFASADDAAQYCYTITNSEQKLLHFRKSYSA